MALSAKCSAYGETTEQRRRHHRIFGQLLRDFRGNDVEVHRILRQSVVPGDRGSVRREHKRNGYVLPEILYRLFAKIIIQNLNAA